MVGLVSPAGRRLFGGLPQQSLRRGKARPSTSWLQTRKMWMPATSARASGRKIACVLFSLCHGWRGSWISRFLASEQHFEARITASAPRRRSDDEKDERKESIEVIQRTRVYT